MNKHIRTPIVLIGFMGAGKTTLGSYMAVESRLTFVDLDQYITQNEGLTIPEIFAQKGEQAFRNLEHHYLNQCLDQYDIISTGGGIIEGEQTFDLLKTISNIIWLDCDINTMYKRINNDSNRPNAKNRSILDLKNLYSRRVSRYNEIAFIKMDSTRTLKDLHDEIFETFRCE